MEGRTQYGLVLCAHTDDYATGKIKKHELTRKDKEDDRMVHVRIHNCRLISDGWFLHIRYPTIQADGAENAPKPQGGMPDG